jgi:hypothetical protein
MRDAGLVHIVNLAGMPGSIMDIAFTHLQQQLVLGMVDEFGNFQCLKVTESTGQFRSLSSAKILEIIQTSPTSNQMFGQVEKKSPDLKIRGLTKDRTGQFFCLWSAEARKM